MDNAVQQLNAALKALRFIAEHTTDQEARIAALAAIRAAGEQP